jgi:hypothetical protein
MSHDPAGPPLPDPRGPVSTAVRAYLENAGPLPADGAPASASPYGDDLQLALYLC